MGGQGSGGNRGYRIPLQLTREMKLALDRLSVKLESADDFPIALRVFRAGLLVYGVLSEDELQAMYLRKKVSDDEAMFLIEYGLVKDFRPVKVEALLEAEERLKLNHTFGNVIDCWNSEMGLKESSKMHYVEEARKYPDLPNAQKLLELAKEESKGHDNKTNALLL